LFTIGKILKPHGLKGDVRVFPSTDEPTRFELLDSVEVVFGDRRPSRTLNIERVWYHQGLVMLKFEGVSDADAADALRGGELHIPDDKALPLAEDEYYARDLYGMAVATEAGEELGTIDDILVTGANDVYSVKGAAGGELLIPAIKQCILNVDVPAKRMIVRLPDGLREL
jgi:16S rRNA processing protein RimM